MGPETLARPGLPRGQKGFQKEATPPHKVQSPRLSSITVYAVSLLLSTPLSVLKILGSIWGHNLRKDPK